MTMPSGQETIPLVGIIPNQSIWEGHREVHKYSPSQFTSWKGIWKRNKIQFLLNIAGRWLSKLDDTMFCGHLKAIT